MLLTDMNEATAVYRLNQQWDWEVVKDGFPSLSLKDIFYMENENGEVIEDDNGYKVFMVTNKDEKDSNKIYVQPAYTVGM